MRTSWRKASARFPAADFARYWVHNGMLQVNGEKMSKSLGNFFTAREVLAKAPAEAVRLVLIRTHYRSIAGFLRCSSGRGEARAGPLLSRARAVPGSRRPADVPARVMAALCDDLNTPLALSAMHGLADKALAGDLRRRLRPARGGQAAGHRAAGLDAWFRGGADRATVEIGSPIVRRHAAGVITSVPMRSVPNGPHGGVVFEEQARWHDQLERCGGIG